MIQFPAQLPTMSRSAATWTYRFLWLLAMLLTLAMPLVILLRGDVAIGSVVFDVGARPTHPLVVVDGDVTLRTTVSYPVIVVRGNVYVDGALNDDLIAVAGDVFLDPHSRVDGNLVVLGGKVYRAPGATVQGTVGATVRKWDGRKVPSFRGTIGRVDLVRQVRLGFVSGLALLVLCLMLAVALPWSIVVTAATGRRYPIRSALAGTTGLLAVPFLLLPLALSLVGLPLAVLLSFGAILVWLAGLTAAGFLVGRRLVGRTRRQTALLRVMIVGLTPILLVLAVPFIGPLFVGAIGVLGAGARIVSFVERERALDAIDAVVALDEFR